MTRNLVDKIASTNTPSGETPTENSESSLQPHDASAVRGLLIGARGKLDSAEALLLDPTPVRVQQAEHLLEDAAHDIRSLECEFKDLSVEASAIREEVNELESVLRRTLALLLGALRIQWHRMRRTGLYIETYTSGGELKVCLQCRPRLDIEV
jgi:hypothetical protein